MSNILGKVLNYFLVPLYTAVLLPQEYGVISELYAYIAILQILYTFGIETAYFRFVSQNPNYSNTIISFILVWNFVFSGAIIFSASSIINFLGYTDKENYVYLICGILIIDSISMIPFAKLRLQHKALLFTVVKISQIALNVIFNLVLLYNNNCNENHCFSGLNAWLDSYNLDRVEYVLMANLLSNAIIFPFLIKQLGRVRFSLSWNKLRVLLVYSFPLFFIGFVNTTNDMFSRITLRYLIPESLCNGMNTEAVVGIFVACCKLSIFMMLGIQAFRYAAEPFYFANANNENRSLIFSHVMYWFVVIGCFVLFSIGVNLDFLSYIFLRRAEYRSTVSIVPYLALSYFLLGIYNNLSIWFKLDNKTYYGLLMGSIGMIINIFLNLILVPIIGYWGSVYAILTANSIMVLLCYLFGQRHYPIQYHTWTCFTYIVSTMSLIMITSNIKYNNTLQSTICNLGITLFFGVTLYYISKRVLLLCDSLVNKSSSISTKKI